MLDWANQFNICIFLDNHQYQSEHHSVECLLAVNAIKSFTTTNTLKHFLTNENDWLFGHVAYDFKNEIYNLTSANSDGIGFQEICFFQPQTVIELKQQEVIISCIDENPQNIFEDILKLITHNSQYTILNSIHLKQKISKQTYIEIIKKIREHILRGDCYELNFCMEFFAENVLLNTINAYNKLVNISPVPFAAYYKLNDKFLLCASPERYIQKKDNSIISQPIKGTHKRDLQNNLYDEILKQQLQKSEKDKSENVMVVDLVRNDLSKICKQGSVAVNELFGVYTFPQVHQLISTVKGELKNDIDFVDVLKATFPMGSMTGAPKLKVMQLTEQYEQSKRGLYSGTIGYIKPNKDFDFNVVIRSIQYNQSKKYLSFQVGGGITFNSNAEEEYEECLLKASAIMQVLQ
ncbi:MAG: anthranilate synthase component I family protein [Bacteroidetes bacterium]|nr:anthranilate synthase component I family protein [Bacteroidota bacterium]MBS1648857.1 anthranilate synthase component I family protein [Bacteroidota bacterium]